MPTSVSMPALGESVTEGTVTQWLKNVGDAVEVDEPLLEVSTDKVDTEIPSPVAGVLTKILVQEDETVEIGAEIAVIGGEGEDAEAPAPAAEEEQAEPEPQPEPEQKAAEPEPEPEPAPEAAAPVATGPETSVTMPALGESVTEGTVTQWLKNVGDAVDVDEPLLEVSTDKVDTEIPSPVAGVLTKILVQEDETVEIGAEIAVIGGEGGEGAAPSETPAESPTPATSEAATTAKAAEPEPEPKPTPEPAPVAHGPGDESPSVDIGTLSGTGPSGTDAGVEGYVTPLVRKLAAEHRVDLGRVRGSGVGGRIRKQDVLKAAEELKAASARAAAPTAASSAPRKQAGDDLALRGRTEKLSRLRRYIADSMVESLHVSATTTQVTEVDVTKIARLRERAAEHGGSAPDFFAFFALATVEALRAHPKLNAVIDADGQEVTYHDVENLGVSVDTERGLLVPVVKDAGKLNLGGLADSIADLTERAHTGLLGPDELGGGTFTLTETGGSGALFGTPIINQPQVAILGTGAVVKRPVVVEDPAMGGEVIAVRSMVYLSLAVDHRLIDGADAGRFLQAVKSRLEEGEFETEIGLG
ncbi:2-oxoglutarate dehydrogenase, E2 component, dihydrolipoamide succinyltransferase [Nocardiopsis sp. DSM 44743]|uniref:Dihydrolipoamide acetyltransferase component of pyruvate dehydrogenase complex n=2 Tax=Nocardiopsis lambiniae TaxID=3075539 RepID=A0ABU2M8A2_9ACTN|nr:2-oxoglutarate dehydrogenase, E2 component, dihydrolipoamide succinyltransferase [Nocardiopsis sp. DSM 44743]MDT0328767.1 2-oxoglutarate dehydrogenase, E2 component, dihydrolipoamide succinyltransferase [Nocardiopsis sp. DSM 44743]